MTFWWSLFCLAVTLEPLDPTSDAYTLLGVSREADQRQIRRAFRTLSLKYHPDKNPDDPKAAQRNFELVSEAYEKLGDEDARAIYDSYGDQEFSSKWEFEMAQRQGKASVSTKDFFSGYSLIKHLNRQRYINHWNRKEHQPFLVDFYAPWCKHCQQLAPIYRKTAAMLEGFAITTAVNCDKQEPLCRELAIQHYPMLKLFARGINGEVYEGKHDPTEIYRWVKTQLDPSYVFLASKEEFEEKVLNSTRPWLLMWTNSAAWCPPCTATAPMMREVAKNLQGLVHVGQVDCAQLRNQMFCQENQILYYPLLRLYPTEGDPTELDPNMGNRYRFPQIGMMKLFTDVSKVLLSDILIDMRQEELPGKIEAIFKYSDDHERLEDIPNMMRDFRGKEGFLWDSLLEEYELTEESFMEDVLPSFSLLTGSLKTEL